MASLFLNPPLLISRTSLPPLSHIPSHTNHKNARTLAPCRAISEGHGERPNPYPAEKLDRRDVLLGGLGGLAGLGSAAPRPASADPIQAPKPYDCHHPTDLPDNVDVECCPPKPRNETMFYKPMYKGKPRVRQPAHDLDAETIVKYKLATARMRALPDDDPRSFKQQAKVHCAYCNDGYYQVGFESEKINIQVHSSWLFFPFHRWQLYFYEKILGKLIDDPDFALPFWNWDNPPGMTMPVIFDDPISPLYDVNRNPLHKPPVIANLEYQKGVENTALPEDKIINANLCTMYRQMVIPNTPELFMGKPYRAGAAPKPGIGALENTPHNKLHVWGGNPRNANNEDLGNFYSSGNDPLFYGLHANVDRLWSVWKTLPGPGRRDFLDPDWKNATFAFFNEEAERVVVKVADAVDTRNLGYVYKDVPILWKDKKPRRSKTVVDSQRRKTAKERVSTRPSDFPLTLDKPLSVVVPRPKRKRSKKEKEDVAEVLEIEGIEFDRTLIVSFEVYVDDEDDTDNIGPENSEFVGTFSSVANGTSKDKDKMMSTSISLAITEALEDLDAEDDDSVVVTLVPQTGIGKVKIGGIKIVLLDDKS